MATWSEMGERAFGGSASESGARDEREGEEE
jgi:hypothetical protein